MSIPLVTLLEAAADRLVVPLADVKAELGITDSTEDGKLTDLILAVGAYAGGPDGLCRPVWRQGYEERTPGTGGPLLPLTRFPVESVDSVEVGKSPVDAATYRVHGADRSQLRRDTGHWPLPCDPDPTPRSNAGQDLNVLATFTAGYLMPGQIADWQATTAYQLGQWVRASDATEVLRFLCTAAGTSAATEPTWPGEGEAVVDGGATWTAHHATELPSDLRRAALMQVVDWYRGGLDIPSGISRESFEGMTLEYTTGQRNAVTAAFSAVLRGYR